jgi:hypothetical protein
VTFNVVGTRLGNGTVNGTYSVLSGLPAGVTAAFVPATFTANGGSAFPSSTLTLSTTAAALPGTYTFTVQLADGADQATSTGTLVIAPRTVTGSFTANNKVYDGTTPATIGSRSLTGAVAGDAVSLTGGTAAFSDKNVANSKTVTGTAFSLTGAQASRYVLASSTLTTTANITAKTLTVTAIASSKIYDGTTAAAVTLSSDRLFGDAITINFTSATFADANVGTGKPVTVTGISISGSDATNYSLASTTATTTANITARALAITATGVNKAYDGTTAATVTLADDRVAGDVLATAYTTAAFADKNVGTGKAINVSGITVTGAAADNYTFNTTTTATANITARALAVTATGVNKPYDGNASATVTLSDNRVSGDVLTFSYTAQFNNKNVGTGKPVAVTGITLGGADAGNYTANTSTTTTADITARALLLTATGTNKVYDATTAAVVTLSDDRVAGDVFTVTYTSATFTDKNVGTGKTISVTGISLSGADAGNYTFSPTATATANVTAAQATGSFTANDKVYNGNTTATIATRSVSGTLLTDDLSLTGGSATFSDKNVAAGKTVTGTGFALGGADAGNYVLQSTTLATTASITARALAVTGTGTNKVYDGTTAATVALSDDRVSGDNVTTSYSSAAFVDKNVGAGKAINVLGITISGADAGNYVANTTCTATADITQKSVTGSFTANDKVYDGNTSATIATRGLSGNISGDDVNLTGGTATFTEKNVGANKTVNGVGFSLTGTDAPNYSLASSSLTATASITARALTISATGVNKVYDGTATATVTLSDNRVSGDVFTDSYATATFADKNVGTAKPISVTGISISGADANNYTFNPTASTSADITQRALTVSAAGVNRVYDATTNATVTLSDDRVSGDAFTTSYAAASFNDKHAGNGKPVSVSGISLSGADAGNYTFDATASTTANITPRGVVVTATGVNKVYDGNDDATVTLSDNRIAGDNFTASFTTAKFADKNVGTGKPITVTGISLSGADAGDYTPNTSASASADITARALTITATGVDKVYDATAAATVTLADDRVAGDVLTDSYASAAFSD